MARKRHGAIATSRDTHAVTPVDFAQPSDSLYGSQMDLEAVSGIDLGAGSVTDGSIVDGGLDGSTAIKPGTLPMAPGGAEIGTYRWNTARGEPVSGRARLAADPVIGVPNYLHIHEEQVGGGNRVPYFGLVTPTDVLLVDDTIGNIIRVGLTGPAEDMGTYWRFPFTPTGYGTEPADNSTIHIMLAPSGGGVVDTTKPLVPAIKSVDSGTAIYEDGQSATGITVVVGYDVDHPTGGMSDLHQYASQITRFALGDNPLAADWSRGQQRVTTSADATGTLDTTINHPSVTPSIKYWVRVAAIDRLGNQSDWSLEEELETKGDLVGPPQVTGLVTEPGMSVIGVRWNAVPVSDLDYVEVRWREKVEPTEWVYGRVSGTILIITGVTNDVVYEVQARSVDSSGNVHTGTVDAQGYGIYVKVDGNPESGWVAAPDVTPVAVGAHTLVWDKALLGNVWAGIINADWITSGTLRAGNPPDVLPPTESSVQIEVWTAFGKLSGRWGTAGIELFNPPDPAIEGSGNPGYKMVLNEAGLVIYSDFGGPDQTKVVTLSPLGIDAASVTFGSMRGGHNLVQNSSFELGAFAASTIINHTWDLAADWNTTRNGADVNVTTDTSSLRMTTI